MYHGSVIFCVLSLVSSNESNVRLSFLSLFFLSFSLEVEGPFAQGMCWKQLKIGLLKMHALENLLLLTREKRA